MKITMHDIAKKAGVSVMTVSNVINNNHKKVSPKTIEKVNEIIEELNYTINMNAKALSGSSHLIGLLYYGSSADYDFSDPFAAEIMNGVVLHTKKKNMFTIVHHISNREDLIEIQKNWKFAGFIAVGFHNDFISDVIQICNSPIVFIDTLVSKDIKDLMDRKDVVFVNNNDYYLAKEGTDYLVDKGFSKIAFLSYEFEETSPSVIQQRYLGYQDSLIEKGIDETKIYNAKDYTKYLDQIRNYEAVLVTADILALDLINNLREAQIDYTNLSIVSFDNLKYSHMVGAKFSSFELNHKKKGEAAVDNLILLIAGEKLSNDEPILVKGELLTRDNTNIRRVNICEY